MYRLIIVGYVLSIFSGWFIYGNVSTGVLSSLTLVGIGLISVVFDKNTYSRSQLKEITFFSLLLFINFIVALINEVSIIIWLSRTSWIIIYMLMLLFIESKDKLHQIMLVVSVSRLVLIVIAFVSLGFTGRATIVLNSPVYSPLVLYAPFYFMKTKQSWLAFFSILIIMLTGSRLLILASIGVVLLQIIKLNVRSIIYLSLFSICLGIASQYISVLDRFNEFQNVSSDLSYLGKINEVRVMFEYFLESPLFGVGIGHIYNNGIDIENFTYTHNFVAFLFGYSGLFGVFILGRKFLNPIYKKTPFQLYFSMVFLFCLSSTSYTLPEMSLHLLLSTSCVRT